MKHESNFYKSLFGALTCPEALIADMQLFVPLGSGFSD